MKPVDIIRLIGDFAGLNIRVTKRHKLYKRITVKADGCTLRAWRPVYHVPPIVSRSYRRLLNVYMKTLEFEWWAAKSPLLIDLRDSLRVVANKMKAMRRQYETADYLYDYVPVTRKSERQSYALVPGLGLQEVTAFSSSEPEPFSSAFCSALRMSFYRSTPF